SKQVLNEAEQKLAEVGKAQQSVSGAEEIEQKTVQIEEAKQTLASATSEEPVQSLSTPPDAPPIPDGPPTFDSRGADPSTVPPGSGYATSVGELKEPAVLQSLPGSHSVPPKFVGYDGFAGGSTTETLTLEGASGAK